MTASTMWLSTMQVAGQAGVSRSTVLNAIIAGRLPAIQTGGQTSPYRVRRDHAHAWVLAYRAKYGEPT